MNAKTVLKFLQKKKKKFLFFTNNSPSLWVTNTPHSNESITRIVCARACVRV